MKTMLNGNIFYLSFQSDEMLVVLVYDIVVQTIRPY
jgi:hypothetical protein